ncbi:MAG TPA: DUF4835 family protein [Bacteroidota bacterium]|nr:DUF4835 family protein [Bacteroidota bacterium]
MKRPPILLFFPAILLILHTSIAQELRCTVTVNLESISTSQRDLLRNFKTDVERYLNNNRYTSEDLEGERIDCSMSVVFKQASGENRYIAQVFIGSLRPAYVNNEKLDKVTPVLRISDEDWEFNYIPNQRMIQDNFNFDPFSHFLDYYAYLIIGYDFDTYKEFSGSQCFQKALNICNMGSAAGSKDWQQTSAGTFSRFGLATELNDVKYNSIRLAYFTYHFDGIDIVQTEPVRAYQNLLKAIKAVSDIRQRVSPTSLLAKQFFDAKYKEIAETFLGYPDRAIYDQLASLDQEHSLIYQDYKKK